MADPAGTLSYAMHWLRQTIADSESFRTWCGAEDQTEALARIHTVVSPPEDGLQYTEEELSAIRPYAMIWSENADSEKEALHTYSSRGQLGVRFVEDVPAAVRGDPEEAGQAFLATMSNIIADMEALAGSAGYLNITNISGGEDMQPVWGHPNDVTQEVIGQWVAFNVLWSG